MAVVCEGWCQAPSPTRRGIHEFSAMFPEVEVGGRETSEIHLVASDYQDGAVQPLRSPGSRRSERDPSNNSCTSQTRVQFTGNLNSVLDQPLITMVFAAINLSQTQTSVCEHYRGLVLTTEKEMRPFAQPSLGRMVTVETFTLIRWFSDGKKKVLPGINQ